MSKHPDAVKASGTRSEGARMWGDFSAAKLSLAAAPKQNDRGSFKQAKVCLLAIGCEQSKSDQNGCFAKMAADSSILYDFAYKNYQSSSLSI